MSRGSARASKIPFAVPQSLRNRRPTLMGAVLDDSKDSVKLREGLEAMKRVNTLDLQTIHDDDREEPTSRGSWSKDTAAEKPRCHWICWGLGLTASMVVLLVFVTVMLVLLFYQQPILDMFLHSGPNVWSEPAADGSSSRAANAYDEEDFWQHFELNEPLCGFISVTGLVFALVYASNYTDAQSRLNEIRNSLAIEAGGVHTAMLLVRTLDDTDPGGALKTRVLLLLASYIEHLAEEIAWEQNGVGEQPVPSNVEVLYATIPFLAEIGSDGDGDDMDRVLVQRTVDVVNQASEARQIRVSQEKRNISPYVYCFLWQMAFVTYLGVMFLQAGSQAMNQFVSLMTITSVATSMMILADLESPYNGLVRVETDIFDTIRRDISLVMQETESPEDGNGGLPGETEQLSLSPTSSSPKQSPSKVRTMSVRTKIDSDFHMRNATNHLSQKGRVRRMSSNDSKTSPLDEAPGSGGTKYQVDKSADNLLPSALR